MKNILYIPLDERPCNLNFAPMLANGTDYTLVTPPLELLGYKKSPANIEGLWEWVFNEAKNFDFAILSLDMLIYGGIIPSRLHHFTIPQCQQHLNNILTLKSINPQMKIYAFSLIMRCPSYSSNDEEPDYYEEYGELIFKLGVLTHKKRLEIASNEDISELTKLETYIPKDIIEDYTSRRVKNTFINFEAMSLVQDNIIDFLIVPQDDSAPLGFTAMDQKLIKDHINCNNLDFKVYMYPGADEVGMTLLTRLINEDKEIRPKVYVKFSSLKGPSIIPLYEDRMLMETLKYHVLCTGGILWDNIEQCDFVWMINTPAEKMFEAWDQNKDEALFNPNKNLIEFIDFMDYVINTKKLPCALADVAYANGGDLQLLRLLQQKGLLFKLASYAGWNTNSNTLGTSISQAMIFNIYGKTKNHLDFLALRYVEDVAYCGYVRNLVKNDHLPNMNMNYFRIDGQRGEASKLIKEKLQEFIEDNIVDSEYNINILDLWMPWSRMFEVGLKIETIKK